MEPTGTKRGGRPRRSLMALRGDLLNQGCKALENMAQDALRHDDSVLDLPG